MTLQDEIGLYCRDVKKNKSTHCEKERQAVERFESDIKKNKTKSFSFVMDWGKASAMIAFAETLKQGKGDDYGKPLILSLWQKFIYANIWGWRYKNDKSKRRFNKIYIQIARKNGKTTFLAPFILLGLLTEPGAEIYIAANQRAQSNISFDVCKSMINQNAELYALMNMTRDAITIDDRRIRPLSKDNNIDGFNPYIIIIDEYHQARNTEMIEALQRGQGQQKNPLLFVITTAGTNLAGPCYQEYKRAEKVLSGIWNDENYFPVIFEQDKGDDWTDIQTYRKSNPNLGVSIPLEYLEKNLREAKQLPSQISGFRTKNLNAWVQNTADTWIPDSEWMDQPKKKIELAGLDCWGAIDLSKINDLTAWTKYFKIDGFFFALHQFYIPADKVEEKRRTDNHMIPAWVDAGWITATPGASIDYTYIRNDIAEDAKIYKIQMIAYDRYYISRVEETLETLPVLDFDQSLKHFAAPTKAWEKDVLDGKIIDNNPVMRWCLSCATVKPDINENYKPMKRKGASSDERIDGVVTSIMAHSLASAAVKPDSSLSSDQIFNFLGINMKQSET
jgi:phage terminase large subunit-like protein